MLEKPFQIRYYMDNDLNQVISINLACLPENYSRPFYHDIHRRFPRTFLVATRDAEVVGYIMCRIETGFSELKKLGLAEKGHIISIAVLQEYRRKGIGRSLVERALRGMLTYKTSESFLEVRVNNIPAIDLYKGLGFKPVRRIIGYYKDGEDAYVMDKYISKEDETES